MRRDEVWLLNLDPTVGAEIRKTRPVVIVNDDAVGVLPLSVVVPIALGVHDAERSLHFYAQVFGFVLFIFTLLSAACQPVSSRIPKETVVSPLSLPVQEGQFASPVSPLPQPTEVEADVARVYAALLRFLLNREGGWPTVYIIRNTDDRIGRPGDPVETPSVTLSPPLQEAIAQELADLSTEIVWIDSFEDAPVDQSSGAVSGGGAVITLGNIKWLDNNRVHVPGGVYYGNVGGFGGIYVVERHEEGWQVVSTTGWEWVS
jgi:hypothetical protein